MKTLIRLVVTSLLTGAIVFSPIKLVLGETEVERFSEGYEVISVNETTGYILVENLGTRLELFDTQSYEVGDLVEVETQIIEDMRGGVSNRYKILH